MQQHIPLTLLRALIAASCALVSGRGTPAPVQTDRAVYQLRVGGTDVEDQIVATYTNRTGRTVYMRPCGHQGPKFELERYVEREWIRLQDYAGCPLVQVAAVEIAPGAQQVDTIPFTLISYRLSHAEPSTSDTYRLIYHDLYWAREEGYRESGTLPEEARLSNAFRIVDE